MSAQLVRRHGLATTVQTFLPRATSLPRRAFLASPKDLALTLKTPFMTISRPHTTSIEASPIELMLLEFALFLLSLLLACLLASHCIRFMYDKFNVEAGGEQDMKETENRVRWASVPNGKWVQNSGDAIVKRVKNVEETGREAAQTPTRQTEKGANWVDEQGQQVLKAGERLGVQAGGTVTKSFFEGIPESPRHLRYGGCDGAMESTPSTDTNSDFRTRARRQNSDEKERLKRERKRLEKTRRLEAKNAKSNPHTKKFLQEGKRGSETAEACVERTDYWLDDVPPSSSVLRERRKLEEAKRRLESLRRSVSRVQEHDEPSRTQPSNITQAQEDIERCESGCPTGGEIPEVREDKMSVEVSITLLGAAPGRENSQVDESEPHCTEAKITVRKVEDDLRSAHHSQDTKRGTEPPKKKDSVSRVRRALDDGVGNSNDVVHDIQNLPSEQQPHTRERDTEPSRKKDPMSLLHRVVDQPGEVLGTDHQKYPPKKEDPSAIKNEAGQSHMTTALPECCQSTTRERGRQSDEVEPENNKASQILTTNALPECCQSTTRKRGQQSDKVEPANEVESENGVEPENETKSKRRREQPVEKTVESGKTSRARSQAQAQLEEAKKNIEKNIEDAFDHLNTELDNFQHSNASRQDDQQLCSCEDELKNEALSQNKVEPKSKEKAQKEVKPKGEARDSPSNPQKPQRKKLVVRTPSSPPSSSDTVQKSGGECCTTGTA
jgi:hypothetical protein